MGSIYIIERNGRREVATKNLTPGRKVYGEELIRIESEEFRLCNPFRCKLAAAVLNGLSPDTIKEGERILYLGTSTGTTSSHISDIIGKSGLLIGVELSARVAREFLENVAKPRSNIIPYVVDARNPRNFNTLGKVDLVYCDIAQQDQTEIAIENCRFHLKKKGKLILIVKSRSIDVLKEPREVYEQEKSKLISAGFKIVKLIELAPYDKDHALILAVT
jgi:fibrillarin-like pre-rRNA processing protein